MHSKGPNQQSIVVDWKDIDNTVIAPTGIDTLQIIDACYSQSSTPGPKEAAPDDWVNRGTLAVLASAASDSGSGNPSAGVNEVAFTKAVAFTLDPALDGVGNRLPAVAFTPSSLWGALPLVDAAFSVLIKDNKMKKAMVDGLYTPKYYELVTYAEETRKIAPLSESCVCDEKRLA